MKLQSNHILLSASDLSSHTACNHLTYLDLFVAKGVFEAPQYRDPMLAILQERGLVFEQAFLQSLRDQGLSIAEPNADEKETSINRTISAMIDGIDVIYQASLKSDIWQGRADFLVKVDKPSTLGSWSYEVIDSKLAKETRTGTILQLCLYSQLVSEIQGVMPEFMHVITPEEGFKKHSYRLDDFLAYYRFVKSRLENTIQNDNGTIPTYPIPCAHCEICNWWKECDNRRRADDHLSLVAGLSNSHVTELKKWEVNTLEGFAGIPLPIERRPAKGAVETYERLREQARVQLESRITLQPVFEILSIESGRGFTKLPEPSEGDIFFDFESDPFVGTQGLEYLFGWVLNNESDGYYSIWAFTIEEEKLAFEHFVDIVMDRWQLFPDLHIYHFTAFEPATLKRLMGKHATRENEIDQMLRAQLFIDLHSITKQAIRAGIEAYSLKELEVLHQFERGYPLREASLQLRILEGFLERKNLVDIPEETIQGVQTYNKEDCLSTKSLRDWLEKLRSQIEESGQIISRPLISDGSASESITEHQQRIQPLYDALINGVPADPSERSPEQHANWLLANMLDWYRREKKALWWEYYRLCDLPDDELIEEKSAIAFLSFTGERQPDKKSFIDLYSFPSQDCDIRIGDKLKTGDGGNLGEVISINTTTGHIEIRKGPKTVDVHPLSIFKHTDVPDKEKEESIIRLASWVVENGINSDGEFRAGRDLLLNIEPRTTPGFSSNDEPQEKAVAWVCSLDNGVLPIQGPPGTGKSHTAAEMICALIQSGKRVGITALSHKVISGLMEKVIKSGNSNGISIQGLQKVSSLSETPNPQIFEVSDNKKVVSEIRNAQVIGGTPFLWSREDMAKSVDVLFVDEAGQLSLIDTVAVSQAASSLVLLGDPQQLKQPQQGSHPEGTEVSALEHILKEQKTIPTEKGVFLDTTWRLHPQICQFVSELFYESRLGSKESLENQRITGNSRFSGSGLWFVPVEHEGNQSSSSEEVDNILGIVSDFLKGDVTYTSSNSETQLISSSDIKIITPYNAQVNALSARLPTGIQIGTVDKFQGQEAPIIIFSMATSSPEDAPRGMEFLYSLNRLNVAASRARACFILVGSPKLFEPDCKSVGQMKLANSFCRFLELSN
jgi:uncharacterized protein